MAKRPNGTGTNTTRPNKQQTRAQVATVIGQQFIRASETYSTVAVGDKRNSSLVALLTGTVAHAAQLNATACAAQKLRLYAPSSAGVVGKSITREQRAYLTGKRGRIHRKAVDTSTAGDVVEVADHPAMQILERPDPFVTTTQWTTGLFLNLECPGAAFLQIVRDNGVPVALVQMPPQYVRIIGSRETFISEYIVGIETTSRTVLPPEDVLYLRYAAHPQSPLYGATWVETIARLAVLEQTAIGAEIARWENGGSPSMIFKAPETVDPDTLELHREEMMQQIRGSSKAGMPIILRNLELQESNVEPRQMGYTEGMNLIRERIYAAAGIPDSVWRVGESNRASAEVGNPQWLGNTILPRINTLAEMLTESFLPLFPGTEGWFFAYENPVAESVDAEIARVQQLVDRGAATTNELRSLQGYEPLDGGDAVPVPADKMAQLQPLVVGVAAGQIKREAGIAMALAMLPTLSRESLAAMFPEPVAPVVPPTPDVPPTPEPTPKSIRATKAFTHWKNRTVKSSIGDVSGPEKALQEVLQRNIGSVMNQALRDDGTIDEAKLANILDDVADKMGALYSASLNAAYADLGESLNVGDDVAAAYIRDRGLELAKSVPETLKELVNNKLAELTASGRLSVGEAIREIRAQVPELSGYQAERIARTETSFAFNEGRVKAFDELDLRKWWDRAGGPCPICEAMAAKYPESKSIKAGEPFTVSVGAQVVSVMNAPAHPNCRCSMEPANAPT